MKKIAVERKKNLSPEDFARDHVEGTGKPVIVTDAMDGWPARSKWTFEFLRASYGSEFGIAPYGMSGEIGKLTNLAAYIDYLEAPDSLPGFWISTRDSKPLRAPPEEPKLPAYLMGWYAFQRHPELYNDIAPAPYFIPDWTLALDRDMRDLFQLTCGHDYWTLYIGPEGSLSDLHQDFWHTHSYLAQVQGRKRAVLFSPEDSGLLYGGQIDPEHPDFERFPLLEKATAYECEIGPGEMLYTPPNWWHYLRGLEKSITVSHNFFNNSNFSAHMTRLVRKLPTLVQNVEKFPSLRENLRIEWRSNGFERSKP